MLEASAAAVPSAEDQVKALAYALWLEEGQPEGRAEAAEPLVLQAVEAALAADPDVARIVLLQGLDQQRAQAL